MIFQYSVCPIQSFHAPNFPKQHEAQEVAEATVLFKPSVGPWLWPLHEPETLMGKISCFYMLKKNESSRYPLVI